MLTMHQCSEFCVFVNSSGGSSAPLVEGRDCRFLLFSRLLDTV